MFHETQRAVETFSETFVQITGLHCPEGGGYYPPPSGQSGAPRTVERNTLVKSGSPSPLSRENFFKKQAALNSPGRPGLLRGGGVLPPPLWTETFRDLESFGRDLDIRAAIWTFNFRVFCPKIVPGPRYFSSGLVPTMPSLSTKSGTHVDRVGLRSFLGWTKNSVTPTYILRRLEVHIRML